MEVKLYLRMLQRSWWIVAVATLTAVIAALACFLFYTTLL